MKPNKILALFAVISLMGAPSCSDDGDLTPLTEVSGETSLITHKSLTFVWEKVADATQYGYEMYDNDGHLVTRSVTGKTSVTIEGLAPATEYTLKVWAYAPLGSGLTTSEPIVIKATTSPLKPIGAPSVTFKRQGARYVFNWKKVANAEAYEYTVVNAAGETEKSGSTTKQSLSIHDLELGDYTLYIKATSTKDGYEAESETVSVAFKVEDIFVWQATGTYRSSLLGISWEATITYYGDDNYAIKGWYGVEKYKLIFYLDYDDPEDIFYMSTTDYPSYDSSTGIFYVPTGRTDLTKVGVYPWYNYSEFSGNQSAGSVKLYVWNTASDDYSVDVFSWSSEQSGPVADDFVGSWTMKLTGESYLTDEDDWVEFDDTSVVTFTKVDDNTIAMPALYFDDVTMNVKINLADKTLTAQPMTVWTYYTLAGKNSSEDPVVGVINDDGSIEFTDWNAWYNGYTFLYQPKAVFTRK